MDGRTDDGGRRRGEERIACSEAGVECVDERRDGRGGGERKLGGGGGGVVEEQRREGVEDSTRGVLGDGGGHVCFEGGCVRGEEEEEAEEEVGRAGDDGCVRE